MELLGLFILVAIIALFGGNTKSKSVTGKNVRSVIGKTNQPVGRPRKGETRHKIYKAPKVKWK